MKSMFALVAAFTAFITWGTGDVFGAIASRAMGALKATFWTWVIYIVAMSVPAPFLMAPLSHLTSPIFLITIALGIINIMAYLAFSEAMRLGNPAIVGTIAGSFVGLTVILSVSFLGAALTLDQIIAILIIIAGLTLTSLNIEELRQRVRKPSRAILLAFATLMGWGVYFAFIKIPITRIGWFWPDYISSWMGIIVLLPFGRRLKLTKAEAKAGLRPATVSAVVSGGGELAYNVGLVYRSSAIVAPIAGAYPVLFVIVSSIVFREPISKLQKLGMAITLVGIVSLAWLSA